MLAAACGVCRNFSGCIYSVILGQTIRRAFSFRHTAMQPVCMDRGYCSFGFHEKMGDISNTLTRWMAAKSWGLYLFHYLFIAMTAYYLTMYTKLPAVLLYLLWQQRDLPVHIWLMRSSAVFRCSGGSSVELEERKIMFAENLIQLRKLNHMSQDELADQIGVSRQTLSKYETGESLPDIERCKRLADVFGVTVDDLINYEKRILLA